MTKHKGECLHETSSNIDAFKVAEHNKLNNADFDRIEIRACTLPEGGRGWRVWGYAA